MALNAIIPQATTAGAVQMAGTLQGADQMMNGGMPAAKLAGNFQQMLAGAVQQTNALELQSDAMVKKLVTGQGVELHDVMIAMEKAGLAFQLTMQVRNKMVDAYQEVMRMQI